MDVVPAPFVLACVTTSHPLQCSDECLRGDAHWRLISPKRCLLGLCARCNRMVESTLVLLSWLTLLLQKENWVHDVYSPCSETMVVVDNGSKRLLT
jgi:hypothetical protein